MITMISGLKKKDMIIIGIMVMFSLLLKCMTG